MEEIDDSKPSTHRQTPVIKPKPIPSFSLSAQKIAARDYMKTFSASKPKPKPLPIPNSAISNQENNEVVDKPEAIPEKLKVVPEKPSMKILQEIQQKQLEFHSKKRDIQEDDEVIPSTLELDRKTNDNGVPLSQRIEEFATQDMLDDEFDMTAIEEFESQADAGEADKVENEVTEEQLLEGWSTMQAGTSNETQADIKVDLSQLPTVTDADGKKVRKVCYYFSIYFKNTSFVSRVDGHLFSTIK